jgi:hypothetical protein
VAQVISERKLLLLLAAVQFTHIMDFNQVKAVHETPPIAGQH